MKKSLLFFSMTFIMLVGNACTGEQETSNNSSDTEDTEIEESVLESNELEELQGLTLNEGAKWLVDSTTNAGMNRIIEMAASFDGEDHKQIGKDIKSELSDIISKCTMQGEDHEQYHIVLHAMLKESKNLKKGKSTSMDKMNTFLDAYSSHFELAE